MVHEEFSEFGCFERTHISFGRMLNVSSCRRGLSLLSTMPFSSLKSTSNRPTSGLNESDVRERPHFVSDKKRSDALVLFEHGLGYSKVAEILEINMNTVHEWAKLYLAGRFKKQIPQKQFRYEQEFKDQCIRMRLDGASWNQISRTMNVSPTTVRRWIEEAQKSTSSSSNVFEGADKE